MKRYHLMNLIKRELIDDLRIGEEIYTYRFCLRTLLDILDCYEDEKFIVQMVSKSYCCYGEQFSCWNDLHFDIPCTKSSLYDNYDWLRRYFKKWRKYLRGKKIYVIKNNPQDDDLSDMTIVIPLRDLIKKDYYISFRKPIIDYHIIRGKIVEVYS